MYVSQISSPPKETKKKKHFLCIALSEDTCPLPRMRWRGTAVATSRRRDVATSRRNDLRRLAAAPTDLHHRVEPNTRVRCLE